MLDCIRENTNEKQINFDVQISIYNANTYFIFNLIASHTYIKLDRWT